MVSYEFPSTIEEAAKAVALHGDSAIVVGGGTVTVPTIAAGNSGYATVIDLHRIDMNSIAIADGRADIGAGAKISQLVTDDNLAFLRSAALAIGAPAVRNLATVGGNLRYGGDLAAAFLALDAEVVLHGSGGETVVRLSEYYQRDAKDSDLISAVRFSPPAVGSYGFYKLARRKLNSTSIVAAAVSKTENGVTIGLVGADERPVVVTSDGGILADNVTESAIRSRLSGQLSGTPPTDYHASSDYRKHIAPLVILRALQTMSA